MKENRYISSSVRSESVRLYTSGMSLNAVARHLGISRPSVRRFLLDSGIQQHSRPRGVYDLDETFFKVINNESKAYWLGFMYADGCVKTTKSGLPKVVQLAIVDREHLLKFREALRSTHPITREKQSKRSFSPGRFIFYYRVSSRKMADDLVAAGCHPRKSKTLIFPSTEILHTSLIPHFLRGYFDGDGSLSFSARGKKVVRRWTLGFSCNLRFGEGLMRTLAQKDVKSSIYPNRSIFEVRIHPENLDGLLYWIYESATVWLDRKREIYEFYLSRCNVDFHDNLGV